jgi:uncharacterized oxidoreductase
MRYQPQHKTRTRESIVRNTANKLRAEGLNGPFLASVITTKELVKQSFASLKAGTLEIRPGQSKLLALMRRLAPDFINGQLWKASKKFVPVST